MSERTHGMAAAYRGAENENVGRAGVCPSCGRKMGSRHHRWVGGAYDEEYPQVVCPCGNTYEPDFGWRSGTTRHHKAVVYPDGEGGYFAHLFTDDCDRNPYVRRNIRSVAVFGDDPDLDDRTAYNRVGVAFADAETLRLYV